jgi:chemotaxis protein methyltransferase CheR
MEACRKGFPGPAFLSKLAAMLPALHAPGVAGRFPPSDARASDPGSDRLLTHEAFERTRKLALELAGIELLDRHRELLGRRSRRLGIRDAAGIIALLRDAEAGDHRASRQLIGLVTTHFTGFFRHSAQFEVAAAHAFGVVQARGRARLWSAAAATGEEPYSLAIALIERFGADDPPVRIVATDIDEVALAAARQGEYGRSALLPLAVARLDRFFGDPTAAGHRAVVPAVRRLVEFRQLNLVASMWPGEGLFDVIFARNVLMYLAARQREAATERLAARLAPGGLLIVDPVEHLGRAARDFAPPVDGVYRQLPSSPACGARDRSRALAKPGV